MKKLSLEMESLSVESFETTAPAGSGRGTVRGRGEDPPPCTQFDSCYCETAYAVCGTGPATIYSCGDTSPSACICLGETDDC